MPNYFFNARRATLEIGEKVIEGGQTIHLTEEEAACDPRLELVADDFEAPALAAASGPEPEHAEYVDPVASQTQDVKSGEDEVGSVIGGPGESVPDLPEDSYPEGAKSIEESEEA
jgi:hypothetical protein